MVRFYTQSIKVLFFLLPNALGEGSNVDVETKLSLLMPELNGKRLV